NRLGLDFKQFSFHHIARVLQGNSFCIFSLFSAFPVCFCPFYLSAPVNWMTQERPSELFPTLSGIPHEVKRRTRSAWPVPRGSRRRRRCRCRRAPVRPSPVPRSPCRSRRGYSPRGEPEAVPCGSISAPAGGRGRAVRHTERSCDPVSRR